MDRLKQHICCEQAKFHNYLWRLIPPEGADEPTRMYEFTEL